MCYNKAMWNPKKIQPKMSMSDYGWLKSEPVIHFDGREMRFATLEQMDEESEPKWFTCCSEKWNLQAPLFWMDSPPIP